MKKKSKEMNTQKKSMPFTEVKSKAMKTKKGDVACEGEKQGDEEKEKGDA